MGSEIRNKLKPIEKNIA